MLRGRASFEVDGEQLDAPAGTFVLCAPRRHTYSGRSGARHDDVAQWAVFPESRTSLKAGSCFAPLRPLYEAGDSAEAADRGRELLAGDPPYADLFYNVACCESLAGQKDQAIAHLRRAIELSERTRPFLEGDSDLDPIRQDPAFNELLAG